ncbi:MAG TPA: dihydropteroate synthase [Thermoanaerobaculia bacterium]|nr:dihydropteroate synthase [Thermoanaerobaculia bacterium]
MKRAPSGADSSFILHPSSFVLPRGRALKLGITPLVMSVLNVTPDSFSDGGVNFEPARAVQAALAMEADGAAIIDVGGESTRPGAEPVGLAAELERVVPVIEGIRRLSDVPLSVDTTKAAVAQAAIDAGADLINDVSALRGDPEMAKVAARAGVPVILMHMRGEPRTMQTLTGYDDVVSDVAHELHGFVDAARSAGVEQILIDPGIGFAKTFDQNLEILARCNELASIAPFVIGASRKGFIGHLTGREPGPDRAAGSLAAVAAAHRGGAAVVRVHDVRATVDFLRVSAAIAAKEPR